MIIPVPNRGVKRKNLRPFRSELSAVCSDILNAMRGFKEHSLHMLVLSEMLELELYEFSRQLKIKLGVDDDRQVIVGMSNDPWFRGGEFDEEGRPQESDCQRN